MRITDIKAAVVEGNFDWTIVCVETDAGIVGHGETRNHFRTRTEAYADPRELAWQLRPWLVGADPTDVEVLFRRIRRFGGPNKRGGGVSAVETALWDITGKALGVPVWKLLGGKVRDRIRLYCDCRAGRPVVDCERDYRLDEPIYTPEAYAAHAKQAEAMETRVVRFTHDLNWGYRLEPVIAEVASVVSLTAESADQAVSAARGAAVVLITSLAQRNLFTASTVARLEGVRVLYVTGVGWDPIDPAACTRQGILLANNPEFCTDEVAEHTLGLVLALLRKIPAAAAAVKERGWAEFTEFQPMRRLRGKTLGIVGFGRAGRRAATLFHALGCEVLVCDHHAAAKAAALRQAGAVPVSLPTLLRRADIVSLHVPLNDNTRGLMGAAEFAQMKPEAVFVNTSRGAVVDEEALVAALRGGALGGAGLDVFAREPLRGSEPICGLDNVVLTPHLASTSEEAVSLEDLAHEVVAVLRGGRPAHPVNPDVPDAD